VRRVKEKFEDPEGELTELRDDKDKKLNLLE
jgi:hypothetical protein